MPMVSLHIEVSNADLDAAERDEQATDLGRRLREIDEAALSTIASAATPERPAAGSGALIGGFTLTIAASREALAGALEAIRTWAAAVPSRSVVIELDDDRLEVTGATQVDGALNTFLAKHSAAE